VAIIPGALAVIFGILGIKSSKKGMAIAGIICGAIAILLGIFITVFALDALQDPTKYGLPADYFESFGY
jgi:Na+/H+ antiporter NhaD/arsenite permease-like protein